MSDRWGSLAELPGQSLRLQSPIAELLQLAGCLCRCQGKAQGNRVERLRPQWESCMEVGSLRRCQTWLAPRKDYRAGCEGCRPVTTPQIGEAV